MRIKDISLLDFRNYRDERFEFSPGINVVTGENAQGKTNLLEAVYMLSCGRSFRSAGKREMIRLGSDCARITGNITSSDRDMELMIAFSGSAPSSMTLNGVKKRRLADFAGALTVVLFAPEDLSLVQGGAAARRRFLDAALCQLRPSYGDTLSRYNKFLENKQRILKYGREKPALYDALDDFSAGLISCGTVIIKRRAELLSLIADEAAKAHDDISGGREKLSLSYSTVSSVSDPSAPASEVAEMLASHMQSHREREIASGMCLSGPHRDDFAIDINGLPARTYASQGQARTAALALISAERSVMRADTGEWPVLLLDDVLSELDDLRKDFILNRIDDGQVIITCCGEDRVAALSSGKVFHIVNGKLSD